MDLILSNPAGFWALAGIPVILAIHLFQRESRTVLISTLFLLKDISPESVEGRRLDRLRHSLLLWLQLLAVLILTWILVGPRWLREDSVQKVAVVVDSSSSMEAFRDRWKEVLERELGRLGRTAATTEWTLLESDPGAGTLYSGNELERLVAALDDWRPRLGAHDVSGALRTGQELVRNEGVLLFVTDHLPEVPEGVEVVALGSPVENCGFAGVVTEWKDGQLIWRVLLRNYGRTVQTRNWWSVVDGGRGPVNQITLQPGQLDEVQGAFPADGKTIELVLEGDGFGLDDRLALVKPEPKKIFYRKVGNNDFGEFLGRLMATFNNVEPAPPGPADLELAAYDPALGRFPKGRGLVFLDEGSGPRAKRLFSGMVIAENHPLVDDLNWRGLVCSGSLEILGADGDEVLVWQGSRPLIFLRKLPEGGPPEARLVPEGGRQLVFNFDPRLSNAERLPAFVLLCHRFVESGRAEKVEFEAVNVDTRQRLGLAVDRMGAAVALRPGTPEIPAMQASILRAPADPGFFEVVQGDRPLLRGAAHFADAREADFMGADSFSSVENKVATLATRNSRQDFLTPVWVLLLTGALLGTWYLQGRRVG